LAHLKYSVGDVVAVGEVPARGLGYNRVAATAFLGGQAFLFPAYAFDFLGLTRGFCVTPIDGLDSRGLSALDHQLLRAVIFERWALAISGLQSDAQAPGRDLVFFLFRLAVVTRLRPRLLVQQLGDPQMDLRVAPRERQATSLLVIPNGEVKPRCFPASAFVICGARSYVPNETRNGTDLCVSNHAGAQTNNRFAM
jgi:hypothetical protein